MINVQPGMRVRVKVVWTLRDFAYLWPHEFVEGIVQSYTEGEEIVIEGADEKRNIIREFYDIQEVPSVEDSFPKLVDSKKRNKYNVLTVVRQIHSTNPVSKGETKMANTKTQTANKAPTKKSQALKIVNRMRGRKNVPARKEIIDELVTKVGLSKAAAATYYQNITSGKWS